MACRAARGLVLPDLGQVSGSLGAARGVGVVRAHKPGGLWALIVTPLFFWGGVFGGVLLSHILAGAVPSALKGLASGFGMGPGVSLSP